MASGPFGTQTGDRVITSKEVTTILRVNPEIITFLRKHEGLPFFKRKKYILFYESEVIRWRNKRLAEDAQVIVHLPTYFVQINIHKFCTYEQFKDRMLRKVFMDGDNVIQYIKRQNIWKDIKDVVGDIVSEFHNKKKHRCQNPKCGRVIHSDLYKDYCYTCRQEVKTVE